MKKILSLFLSILMLCSITAGIDFSAQAATSNGYEYTVNNSKATITGYSGSATTLTIPSKLGGYTVTNIDGLAFWGDTSVSNITIPNGVTSIGEGAFYECSNLKSITIPNTVTSIGEGAFACCYSLTSISIPSSVTNIGYRAFNRCTSLTSITIPTSLKTIPEDMFRYCTALKSVTISNGVKTISSGAFLYCENLKSVTIPSSVTSIGAYAVGYKSEGSKISGFTIYGTKGSAAETYAKNNGFTFKTSSSSSKKTDASKYTVTLSATSYTYNGKAKKPSVTVKNTKGSKVSSSNYTVSYVSRSTGKTVSEMKSVGKYYVKVTFKGNYSGTIKKGVTIKPKKTSISSVSAGSGKFTVKWSKVTTQTTGYQVQYSTSSDFSSKTTKTISKNTTTSKTITGLTGGKKYYVRVRTYKTVKIDGKSTKIYSDWSDKKSVTTPCTTHTYSVKYTTKATTDKKGVAKYTCTVCGATKTKNYAKIKSVTLSSASYTYDGNAKKPTVTVKDADGNTISSKYYTVTYINRANSQTTGTMSAVGKYYVKITFKTKYSGTVKKTVTIKPKATSFTTNTANTSGLKLKWNKVNDVTGYQIRYSTSKSFPSSSTTTKTVSGTSKTITGLQLNKTYYVSVRTYKTVKVDGSSEKIYSSWSSAKAVSTPTVSVSKTSYTYAAGTCVEPSVTVKNASGSTIGKSNYSVTYIKQSTGKTTKQMTAVGMYYVQVKLDNYAAYKKEITIKPKTTSLSVAATDNGGEIKISWDKVSSASYYEIQYSKYEDFSVYDYELIFDSSTTSKTISDLDGGTTYYVRIRLGQFVEADNVLYIDSNWSAVKSVETKAETYTSKYKAFIAQSNYKNGASWGAGQRPLLSTYSATGCAAYVCDFCKYVYGVESYENAKSTYKSVSQIKAGDVLHIYNSTYGQHWIVVLERYDDGTLYTAEGNYLPGVVRIGKNYNISGDIITSGNLNYSLTTGYHMQ